MLFSQRFAVNQILRQLCGVLLLSNSTFLTGELTQIVWHVLQMGLDDGWVNVLVVPQKMEILGVVLKVCL